MSVHALRPDKYKAYRARKKAAGLKQVRLWTLDTSVPGFQARLEADIALINAGEGERETLAFGEALMAEIYSTDDEAEAY